jgi:drug/metabolite transporter (DMT)-like permease
LIGIGWIGFGAGILWGFSNIAFTVALQNTEVATVLIILASNPMFSVVFSYLLLGESTNMRTAITGLVCFGCIAFIFYQSVASADYGQRSLVGVICAVLAASSFGLYFVLIRVAIKYQKSEPDMNACNILSGATVAVVSAILGQGVRFSSISGRDVLYLIIQGVFVIPVAFTLLVIGPQYIPAPEVCLYSFIETVLGPLWVWLGGYEAPSQFAIYGGAILLFTLGANTIVELNSITDHSDTSFTEVNNDECEKSHEAGQVDAAHIKNENFADSQPENACSGISVQKLEAIYIALGDCESCTTVVNHLR